MKKGQFLIITAVVVVTVLILIKIESTYFSPIEERPETNFINTFNNLRDELIRAGVIATSIQKYDPVYNFSNFINNKEDTEIFYSITDFNVETLNITIGNFLDETIQNIDITQNLTDETKSITSLSPGSMDWVDFTFSPTSEISVQINISYTYSSNIINHTFITKTGPSKRYMTVFYDFKLYDKNSYIRDKFSILGEV